MSAWLGQQQQALLQAIQGSGEPPSGLVALPGLALQRGLVAYQGHARSLGERTLASVFTRLAAHLGADDFAALAWSFWRHDAPQCGDLAQWGAGLEAFLMNRAGAASGLPGVARLEWALHQAERAADATLDADSLQCLATDAPDALQLTLRPGVALLPMEPEALAWLEVAGSGVAGLLVWRQGWRAEWAPVTGPQAAFLGAVLAGRSLQQALEAAARPGSLPGTPDQADQADQAFDFGAWLQQALRHGWLLGAARLPDRQA